MSRSSGIPLHVRALIAIGLTVGFYSLTWGLILGLLMLPFWEYATEGLISIKLALIAFGSAWTVFLGIAPRREEFHETGPKLSESSHPALFDAITEMARQTGQRAPDSVYLLRDVNAFVADWRQVGSTANQRIMGIGMPLFALLTVAELRAVLAHEFGHYVAGDTKIGPRVYRTREKLRRMVVILESRDSALTYVFRLYAKLFLRVSAAVSKKQEYTADATAASLTSAQIVVAALQRTAAGAAAYEQFWNTEVVPALRQGYHPPLVDGFARFLAAPRIASWVAANTNQSVASPYDSHPSLSERTAALLSMAAIRQPDGAVADDGRPASSLLAHQLQEERRLLEAQGAPPTLQPISWDEIPLTVLPANLYLAVAGAANYLAGITFNELPLVCAGPNTLPNLLRMAPEPGTTDEQPWRDASWVIGAVIILAVVDVIKSGLNANMEISSRPGEPVVIHSGDVGILPFGVCEALASGRLTSDGWRTWCSQAGIGSLDLGAAVESMKLVPTPRQVAERPRRHL